MSAHLVLSRRRFVQGLGLCATGLWLGLYRVSGQQATTEPSGRTGPKPPTSSPAEQNAAEGLKPNVFIHVASDGTTTIVCHRSEMGQGIRSSLPVLLADELGADMARVQIAQADGDKAYGDQDTDGSNSIRGFYDDLRRAAATARLMLITAAAARWQVEAGTLTTENHAVVDRANNRTLGFGELADEAGKLPVPRPADVKLRPTEELRHVGKPMPLLDGRAFVCGTARYGADIRLPNMLIAAIARPPVVGANVRDFDESAARAVSGVKQVVRMPDPKPPYAFQPWGGVAVLAENTWTAFKGRDALRATWSDGPNSNFGTTRYRDQLFESVGAPGEVMRHVGDVDTALRSAARTVEAQYFVRHLPHLSMEPPAAIARYEPANGGTCEVWAPTQNPQGARAEVARVLGIPPERVTVHVTFLGGAFGRKSKSDFISEAAFLAKATGAPVRVQFTRADDLHNDYYNAANAQHFTVGLDQNGRVTAWRLRTAFPPIGSTFNPKLNTPSAGDLQQGVLDVALDVPNVRIEACSADAHVRVGWLRSVYNIFHGFGVNSFIDEIAHARGQDPRDVMLEIYGPARILSLEDLGISKLENYGRPLSQHPVDAGRLRGVIERVTGLADWKNRNGRALGLAAHRSFSSYAAVVAAVSGSSPADARVDEVWIVLDGGLLINPDRVRAQMEGSVLNGMNHILYGGVTHEAGKVRENNFDTMPITRMAAAPKNIHIDFMRSNHPPGGVGEPGVPPVAPAIANAIFALTGKRVREFGIQHPA